MTSGFDALFTTPVADASSASHVSPFEVIVLGGGTAGIISALTLAEHGIRTLLLEAGPLLLLTNVLDTDLRFNRDAQRALVAPLSASPLMADGAQFGSLIYCLGGRGLFWTGATPRFDPSNFTGWPFSYTDLEPYYNWAEDLFGVNERLGETVLAQLVTRRLRVAGYEALPGPTAIDRPGPLDDRVGGNVGNALGPLLRSPFFAGAGSKLLTICTNAFAARIDHNGTVASSVGVAIPAGDMFSIAGKAFVIACGGFESVRLALASQLPDRSGLLGRVICDHLFVRAFYPLPPGYYADVPEQAVVYVRATSSRPFQLELHLPDDNLFALNPSSWAPAQTPDYSVMVRGFAPTQARTDNFIEIVPGAAGRAKYLVHLPYSPDDLTLRQAMEDELERVRAALPADRAQVQVMPPGTSHHESGGLIAGDDPAASVVDGFGRFHRVGNIVVADASTWPTSTPYNPHLTIAAIARRQALALTERLRQ
jgi:choline dehydrogenase-like flavoprotein